MIELLIFDVRSITIFGGGFLGSELAVALGNRGRKSDFQVIQAYQEAGNMGKVLPDYLSEWTTDKVRSEGVTVLPNNTVKAVTKGDSTNLKVTMKSGKVVDTDHMVVAVSLSLSQRKIFPNLSFSSRLVSSRTWSWPRLVNWKLIPSMEDSR